ncbi:hypothetical protein [Aquipseudomonas guryensis]|jgi:hypothetical protein|uniref:Uncharacterized protein n=1 Tax=Aquipseudomonas guryensis TaxID=2759165 RepID=A0A7W4D8F0_9GAMM|nr:hypothetical protein [Pseudomonas guryensis]MBB1517909.1 hypothetical protein [Pseudomonas guryensis]
MAHSSCWQAASVAKVNTRAQQIKRACGEQESAACFVSQGNSRQWRRAATDPRGQDFFASNKKPAEAGFSQTIPTSCQLPSWRWSIILDPAARPAQQ